MAPIVATLLANGISILGNAIMAKGKDVIEKELGVQLPDNPTSEDMVALRQLELQYEEKLIQVAVDDKKLDIENVNNAREMNARIQESGNSSELAKNAAYYLDFIIVLATLVMGYTIIWTAVPVDNRDLFFTAFGSLMTLCGTIVNFHRGSSQGSKDKQGGKA